MDSRRATIRNMRSKCRCSYVLQFTFRHAVCCVLHRPPSQVIHCTVLFSQSVDQNGLVTKFGIELTAPHEGEINREPGQGRRSLSGFVTIERSIAVHRTQEPGRRSSKSRRSKCLRPPLNSQRPADSRQAVSPRNEIPEKFDLAEN